jgi:hypothetical protein
MLKKDIDKIFDGLCSKAINCDIMRTAICDGLEKTALEVFCKNCPKNDSRDSNPSKR